MNSDPMTEAQGREITGLLEKILSQLESIGQDTVSLGRMETDLDTLAGEVGEILSIVQEK